MGKKVPNKDFKDKVKFILNLGEKFREKGKSRIDNGLNKSIRKANYCKISRR